MAKITLQILSAALNQTQQLLFDELPESLGEPSRTAGFFIPKLSRREIEFLEFFSVGFGTFLRIRRWRDHSPKTA